MNLGEVIRESVTQIWSRKGGKSVRKYRCTSGTRKGRIVANPSTCTKPKNLKKAASLKRTKAMKGSNLRIKAARTKRSNPAAKKLRRVNLKPRKM